MQSWAMDCPVAAEAGDGGSPAESVCMPLTLPITATGEQALSHFLQV